MKFDHYEYHMAGEFLCALVNGDETGLSDDESSDLADFIETLPPGGHWTDDPSDRGEYYRLCDVCGRFALCVTALYFAPVKEASE